MDPSALPTATVTQREQLMVERQVFQIFNIFASVPHSAQTLMLEIDREKHVEYLTQGLKQLSSSFCVLDANRPWLCYWILHSIALLGEFVDPDLEDNAIDFLSRCQDPDGGFGGGPGQLPHLATTYAAVNSLITLGGDKSLSSINRDKLYMFLRRMKDKSGGFRMHDAGEIDVRACYTAISVASVMNILDNELVENVGDYILSCQTYEGGIAGEPGSEAHGGYTFCGVATMILINEVNRLDLPSLIDWVVFRQGHECGFQGRTNKLVDGCYSFWQGGVFPLLRRLHPVIDEQLGLPNAGEGTQTETSDSSEEEEEESSHVTSSKLDEAIHRHGDVENASFPAELNNIGFQFLKQYAKKEPLFQNIALQQYLLLCSQLPEGGFRDKPGKARDYYHTCYCLSGLSVSQYMESKNENSPPPPRAVFGPYANLVEPVHPLFNVVLDRYYEAHEFLTRS